MDGVVEVIAPRVPEGLGLLLKVRTSGRFYRVAPTRDPRQPRLWRLLVYRCTPGGMPDPAERPWAGSGGTSREDLPATLAAIRADVDAWLAREECRELRRWLLATDPAAADRAASGSDRARTTSREQPIGAVATGGARNAP